MREMIVLTGAAILFLAALSVPLRLRWKNPEKYRGKRWLFNLMADSGEKFMFK